LSGLKILLLQSLVILILRGHYVIALTGTWHEVCAQIEM